MESMIRQAEYSKEKYGKEYMVTDYMGCKQVWPARDKLPDTVRVLYRTNEHHEDRVTWDEAMNQLLNKFDGGVR